MMKLTYNFIFKNFSPLHRFFHSSLNIHSLNSFYNKLNSTEDGFINKSNHWLITFDTQRFPDKDKFKTIIKKYLLERDNLDYYILIKVRYDGNIYKMAGKQITFSLNNKDEIDSKLDELYFTLLTRVAILMENYNIIANNLIYIQLTLKYFNKDLLTDLKFDSDFVLKDKPLDIKKSIVHAPFQIEDDHSLCFIINDITLLSPNINLKFNINATNYNINLICNQDTFDVITKNSSTFYFRSVVNPHYILVVVNINSNTTYKISFDMLGNLITFDKDTKDLSMIVRETNNNSIVKYDTKTNKIVSLRRTVVNVIPIKPVQKKYTKNIFENTKIGVIDLETYKNNKLNKDFVYSGGVFTYLDSKPKLFYIDKITLDSSQIIMDMIDHMFSSKYNGVTFYCHNLGGYDIYFVIKILLD